MDRIPETSRRLANKLAALMLAEPTRRLTHLIDLSTIAEPQWMISDEKLETGLDKLLLQLKVETVTIPVAAVDPALLLRVMPS